MRNFIACLGFEIIPMPFHRATTWVALVACMAIPAMAGEKFNPMPVVIQSPTDSLNAVASRLSVPGENPDLLPKKFDAAWIAQLAQHGTPKTYTKFNSEEFAYIGMPIGGIGAGELYLGGDGKLWDWDIFNTRVEPNPVENGAAYADPHQANNAKDDSENVLDQGFVLRTVANGKTGTWTLDRTGFASVEFTGQYPVGQVVYTDFGCPVKVSLEAFSPFIPGNVADSSYPATVLNYTLINSSNAPVECTLAGWLENAVGIETRKEQALTLHNEIATEANATVLNLSAAPEANPTAPGSRAPIVLDDFEAGTYDTWTVEGTAFGKTPMRSDRPPKGFEGKYYADSSGGKDDKPTGKLTSKPFPLERNFITLFVAGGRDPAKESVSLIVDGETIATASGGGDKTVRMVTWDVRAQAGKTAQIEIADNDSGAWGHIMVDNIVLRDVPVEPSTPGLVQDRPDMGTLALTLLGDPKTTEGVAQLGAKESPGQALDTAPAATADIIGYDPALKRAGALRRHVTLAPRQSATITFLVTWYFPNPLHLGLKTSNQRGYATRFKSAQDVADQLAPNLDHLAQATRLWHDTFYDSTLPCWFLDRTFANASTLATSTAYLLGDGRFYGYEGRYSCPGTCTHVWGYQPLLGYLFPDLEKALLDQAEFVPSVGLGDKGGIAMRGEFEKTVPADGESGVILRAYLAHRMSADDTFLQTHYPAIKQAMNFSMAQWDGGHKGVLAGPQPNTMDASWSGQVPWLSLYYQAALRATAEMADGMNDADYANMLRATAEAGRATVENTLFDGEYFSILADPAAKGQGSAKGCALDQLLGQSWACQVGLGAIVDPAKAQSALNAIWKNNFSTDLGAFRAQYPGRDFAEAREGGLLMCSFPKGTDKSLTAPNAYFNECWTGSEYTTAALMMWAGLADKALAEVRTIHDRYDGGKRNPWNEVECGSHYARAMASYGVFTAAEGYEYDGPRDYIAFAPRLTPENFRAAFTAAEGFGTYSQKSDITSLNATVAMKYGRLRLKSLALALPVGDVAARTTVKIDGVPQDLQARVQDGRLLVTFAGKAILNAGQSLTVDCR